MFLLIIGGLVGGYWLLNKQYKSNSVDIVQLEFLPTKTGLKVTEDKSLKRKKTEEELKEYSKLSDQLKKYSN